MSFRGKYRLGEEVVIGVLCLNASGVPTVPDDNPVAKIWDINGNKVFNKKIPVQDRYAQTGYFQANIYLGGAYAVGLYSVTYSYSTGGQAFVGIDEDNFEIVAGGDVDGITESLYFYHRPQADYVLQQLNSGKIKKRRNPRF